MTTLENAVIVTEKEFEALTSKGKVFVPGEKKGAYTKDDVLYVDGTPYLCVKDGSQTLPPTGSGWKAIIVN